MGADNDKILKNTTPISLYSVCIIGGILKGITNSNYKGGEIVGKNKNNQLKNNKNAQPTKADTEFAGENGLEKIALKAQKSHNK